MKNNYKVYGVNKSWNITNLNQALIHAQRESKSCFRVSVFEGNRKIAVFSFGKQIA